MGFKSLNASWRIIAAAFCRLWPSDWSHMTSDMDPWSATHSGFTRPGSHWEDNPERLAQSRLSQQSVNYWLLLFISSIPFLTDNEQNYIDICMQLSVAICFEFLLLFFFFFCSFVIFPSFSLGLCAFFCAVTYFSMCCVLFNHDVFAYECVLYNVM